MTKPDASSHSSTGAPAGGRFGVSPAAGYGGDVTPEQAAQWMASGEAVLIDVRSDAEREWVGFVPGAVALAWKHWPGMALNPS